MKMPYLNAPETSVDMINMFGGYNHNINISDGEFYDMENMNGDKYPAIRSIPTRKGGYSVNIDQTDVAIHVWNAEEGHYDSYVPLGKQMVKFPSKTLNGVSLVKNYSIKNLVPVNKNGTPIINSSVDAQYSDRKSAGESTADYLNRTARSEVPPEDPQNNDLWIDTSSAVSKMKKYSSQLDDWVEIETYVSADVEGEEKVDSSTALNVPSFVNDTDSSGIGICSLPSGSSGNFNVSTLENKKPAMAVSFNTFLASSGTGKSVSCSNAVPDLDFAIECNNRIWGCKYSESGSGKNEIRASKPGAPGQWNYYNNTAMDSYSLSVGVKGEFTGAITYQSNPVFFKEDCIIRIYGNYPANYQTKLIYGKGCQKRSAGSIQILNDYVYYLADDGVYRWGGGSPKKISECFGGERYHNAVAGACGNNYWITCQDKNNKYITFVYNDKTNVWYVEDKGNPVVCYITYNGSLYRDGEFLMGEEAVTTNDDNVHFMLQTGNIGYAITQRKYINKITMRMKLGLNTVCKILIDYDSNNDWRVVSDIKATGRTNTIAIPIIPQRCDHFAIKIEGDGSIELHNIAKYYEEGSEYA